MKHLIIIFIASVILIGCSSDGSSDAAQPLNSARLRNLVKDASEGKKEANERLGGLIDYSLPVNKDYSKLITDSLHLQGGRTVFYVMLEYSNPAYNRFAIYDKDYKAYLIDKSLNGDMAFEVLKKDKFEFIKIVESFLSKDIISLKRLSLYRVDKYSAPLVFRSYISMMTPELFLSQEIDSVAADVITTELMLPAQFETLASKDTFYYDSKAGRYSSRSSRFDSLIRQQVKNFSGQPVLPEITDENSLRRLLKK